MRELTTRLANALAPFAVDVFKPVGRNAFSITVTGGAIHDAREAMREYLENPPAPPTPLVSATERDIVAQREALRDLLILAKRNNGSDMIAAVDAVEKAFAPLLASGNHGKA